MLIPKEFNFCTVNLFFELKLFFLFNNKVKNTKIYIQSIYD